MKRFFLLCILLLAAVSGAYAQSLIGTWSARIMESDTDQSEEVRTDMKITGRDNLTFTENNYTRNMSCKVTVTAQSKGESLDMIIRVKGAVSGTWKLQGKTLTLTPDKKARPVLTVDTENCPGIVQALIIGPVKKELKEALKEKEELEMTSFTDTEFTVVDSGESTTYNKVK